MHVPANRHSFWQSGAAGFSRGQHGISSGIVDIAEGAVATRPLTGVVNGPAISPTIARIASSLRTQVPISIDHRMSQARGVGKEASCAATREISNVEKSQTPYGFFLPLPRRMSAACGHRDEGDFKKFSFADEALVECAQRGVPVKCRRQCGPIEGASHAASPTGEVAVAFVFATVRVERRQPRRVRRHSGRQGLVGKRMAAWKRGSGSN